ncbi:MAG: ATP synthase subunit I [Deltaproteobacteria bacterium]|nr:ATP synthase subunit I [Deltaproteobacteria bacterium]
MELTDPRHLKIANWVVLTMLVATGFLWQGREFALGILAGGLVAVINFHLLHRTLRETLGRLGQVQEEDAPGRAKAFFAGRQLLRFFVLLTIIFLLVRYGWVNIFGLLVGLSTVVVTLILAGILAIFKLKNKEANHTHGTSHSVT